MISCHGVKKRRDESLNIAENTVVQLSAMCHLAVTEYVHDILISKLL